MTNTKTHEDLSCSVDLNMSEVLTSKQKSIPKKTSQPQKESEDKAITNSEEFTQGQQEEGFNGFGFSDALLKTLKDKGYNEPSPIQKAAIPELMLGRDLVGQAQTGTGKTAAFALPILERLNGGCRLPQVLVLAPTRELAMQVADSFRAYAAGHPHFKFLAIYGGADFRSQINSLRRGIDVIVGTPGRVMDHMRQGTLNTSELRCLVLDEADEMLRMGFIDDVEWILEQLPEERQMVLFSATMPSEVRRLSKRFLNQPAEITIKAQEKEARLIKQKYIVLQNSYKTEALKRVLEAVTGEGVIIFARTKAITLTLAEVLETSGHDVAVLNGDVPQNQRERTVERLRSGGINILVATDVAARGLDVDRIELVINYDMPFDSEAYVHRIGRTGRAGRKGEAILFVSPRERRFVHNLERAVGQQIEEMSIPNNEVINQSRVERLRNRLIQAAKIQRDNSKETEVLQGLLQQVSEELEISQDQLALAAINLAIGSAPLLVQGNEDWLKPASHKNRRDDRSISRRRNERDTNYPEDHMERFRVEVGRKDRIKPGNLVGAIANESGLQGRKIGRIQIFDCYSLVDLPKGMPKDVFEDLKKVKVLNKELQIHRIN